VALWGCLAPVAAHAGKGEKVLSVVPHFMTWTVNQDDQERSATGGGVGVDLERGVTDTAWLRGSATGSLLDGPDGLCWSAGATVGITYALDVLRYVPYANLGVGALFVGGNGVDLEIKPVVELGFGLDSLQSRSFSWGVVLRFDSFASEARFFSVGPRISWRWGFF
jgi:hypothetical protein